VDLKFFYFDIETGGHALHVYESTDLKCGFWDNTDYIELTVTNPDAGVVHCAVWNRRDEDTGQLLEIFQRGPYLYCQIDGMGWNGPLVNMCASLLVGQLFRPFK